ncbi:MAG: cupredoxin domain-containing protein [Candidatus Eremiobacteraeota bacterium]|nr:cupredoxin domain-containing protein [Candidatus Eremiobacteraeota bacterium]
MKKLAFVFALAMVAAVSGSPAWAHPSIDVAVANWKFTPNTITLHVGQTTTLRFTSTEGVHGVQSDDLGIPATTLPPNKLVSIEVTPKKAGTFVIHCAVICGQGHANMALTVKVVEGGA